MIAITFLPIIVQSRDAPPSTQSTGFRRLLRELLKPLEDPAVDARAINVLEEFQPPPWPGIPKISSEYVTLIAHYYRAEMSRMSGWRDRIDRTSNWAITVVGAMLSVSLSTSTAHHGVLLRPRRPRCQGGDCDNPRRE